jgi:peptidoglycan/LPS O-acetylase OafA/YrhL
MAVPAVESPATVDDAIFLVALVGVPLLIGAVLGYLQRPWWWAAVVAVVVFLLFVIIPAPEEGESRVASGDIVFLLVASLIVAAIAWVGAFLGRWLARRRVAAR